MPPLKNLKYEKMALAIFKGKSAREACIEAGYKVGKSLSIYYKIANEPFFRTRMAELQEKMAQETIVSHAWVLGKLKKVALRCMTKKDFNPPGANRALELLGKSIGMFADRHELSGKNGGPIESRIDLSALKAKEREILRTLLKSRAGESDGGDRGT